MILATTELTDVEVERVQREMEQEAAISAAPATTKTVNDPDPYETMGNGVQFQKCGGGRRVIRKKIGGS